MPRLAQTDRPPAVVVVEVVTPTPGTPTRARTPVGEGIDGRGRATGGGGTADGGRHAFPGAPWPASANWASRAATSQSCTAPGVATDGPHSTPLRCQ
jgi:hypothetical protein